MLIDINRIIVNDRIGYSNSDYISLAESINKRGLINQIVVDKDYTLIDGARRLRACKYLGWPVIEAYVISEKLPMDNSELEEIGTPTRQLKWDARLLRKVLPKPHHKDRKPCFICGDHKNITEVHYLVQLSELANLINKGIVSPKNVTSTIAWLCPNCHAYVHAAMRGNIDAAMDVYMSPKWRSRYEELNTHRLTAIRELIEQGD